MATAEEGCLLEENPSLAEEDAGCVLEENPCLCPEQLDGLLIRPSSPASPRLELNETEENREEAEDKIRRRSAKGGEQRPPGGPPGGFVPLGDATCGRWAPSVAPEAAEHRGGRLSARSSSCDSISSEDEEEVEIPFARELPEWVELEVSLYRSAASEPLGIVLDREGCFVVAVRPASPACGKLLPGDELIAVNGVRCAPEAPAAEIVRQMPLPPRGEYRLSVRRPSVAGRSLPGEAQVDAQLRAQREALAPAPRAQPTHNPMPDMAEMRRKAESGPMDPQTERQLKRMWHSHARKPLGDRLAAAEMLRAEGNDHFSSGKFKEALDEYAYALETFKYEIANVARDQQGAELGDLGRGLSSDDLPRIQAVRVPCLLNSAAARLKLAVQEANAEAERMRAEGRMPPPPPPAGLQPVACGEASKGLLMQVLDDVAEALRARPAAAVRAKAHFRAAQAHAGLENWREAWSAASLARELQPASAEIKELQLKIQRELRLLQRSERESKRAGAFGTGTNANILQRDERKEFRARLALAHRLLPPAGPDAESRRRRQAAEPVLEKAAASGWSQLSPAEQADFEDLWKAALPSLPPAEVRRGREEGVFPPRDQERVFGSNLPRALMRQPLEGPLGWLSPAQRERANGIAAEIFARGAEQLDFDQRRFAEGLALLAPSSARNAWHERPLGKGGASLLLSSVNQHLWPFPPPALRVERVAAGASLDALAAARNDAMVGAWRHALSAGWEWLCVLADDFEYLAGPTLQFISLLPYVVASASDAMPEWQLLLLSRADSSAEFRAMAGGNVGAKLDAVLLGGLASAKVGEDGCWRLAAPTHAPAGWVFKASLLRALLKEHDEQKPTAGRLNVWLWEQMAERGLLGRALEVETPMVATRR